MTKKPTTRKQRLLRFGLGSLAVVILLWFLPYAVPLPESLEGPPPQSPVITDRNGEPLARLTLPNSYRARSVPWDDIPEDIITCTLAAEDKRFWKHPGIDILAIGRASWDLVRSREIVSGASTITQQLVKISGPPAERNLRTKAYEALAAIKLERRWEKREILTEYLNRVDYGNRSTGISEASRSFFQKPLPDLSLSECALLAGLPQSPSWLNPLRHPDRATKRKLMVLDRVEATGWTTKERVERARNEPMVLRPLKSTKLAPWLAGIAPPEPKNGSIRSTIDGGLQRDVEEIVREEVRLLRESNLRHAAVVVVDNRTAEILTLVSSANWNDPRGGQINGAFAPRSPGSALKPFTYLLAVETGGRSSASIVADIPSPYRTPQGVDLPQNYDRRYRGPVMLRDALACSLNVPAMRELNRLGGPRPLHRLLVEWGITTLGSEPEMHGLGLTIGNAPVRLIELAGAYSTLARGGWHRKPHLFPAANEPATRTSVDSDSCLVISEILADPVARSASFPPGGPLDLPFPCAVKTGTSSDFRDNWCIGYTRDFTVGVWAGNFENQPMKGISGIDGAAPIFRRTMLRIHETEKPSWFAEIDTWPKVLVDPRSGKIQSSRTIETREVRIPEEMIPSSASPHDYDADGKLLLDEPFTSWFEGPHNHRRSEFALREETVRIRPLRILSPENNATFLLDPEVPGSGSRLRPITDPAEVAEWSCDTLSLSGQATNPVILLSPGTHELVVRDTRTNTTRTITIHVRSL